METKIRVTKVNNTLGFDPDMEALKKCGDPIEVERTTFECIRFEVTHAMVVTVLTTRDLDAKTVLDTAMIGLKTTQHLNDTDNESEIRMSYGPSLVSGKEDNTIYITIPCYEIDLFDTRTHLHERRYAVECVSCNLARIRHFKVYRIIDDDDNLAYLGQF